MKILKAVVVIMVILILWCSCEYNDLRPEPSALSINLRWVKAYPEETRDQVITGIAWELSYLGASLPPGAMKRVVYWASDDHLILDIQAAEFPDAAIPAWTAIIAALRQTEEYTQRGGIDIGRFIMLTLNSTNHYYAITGAHKQLIEFRESYTFDKKKAAVLTSSVAYGNRLIEIANADASGTVACIAAEGPGTVPDNTFIEEEYEVIDLMANGQLRFALYDAQGHLKTSASPLLTIASKPAKCLWCHEVTLTNPIQDYPATNGFYNKDEFSALIDNRKLRIHDYRLGLKSDIDFSQTQAHTQMELLYLSFMEPSAERLALEWGLSPDEVKSRLQNAPLHTNPELTSSGQLYSRKDIDTQSPYRALQVPEDAREFSSYEPAVVVP